ETLRVLFSLRRPAVRTPVRQWLYRAPRGFRWRYRGVVRAHLSAATARRHRPRAHRGRRDALLRLLALLRRAIGTARRSGRAVLHRQHHLVVRRRPHAALVSG